MKRIGILLTLLLAVSFTTQTFAQRAIKNGFSVQGVFSFPSATYGAEKDDEVPDDLQYGVGLGFQIGNRWYIAPQEKFGVGIMVNWMDFNFAFASGTESGMDWARTTMDLTFIEFGPIGTVALNDDMAIDGFVNLRPTVLISGSTFDDVASGSLGAGVTYTAGAAFRWKVLSVGLEYVAGKVGSTGTSDIEGSVDYDFDAVANNFRLVIGAKF